LTSIEELLSKTATLPRLPAPIERLLLLNPSDPGFFDEACAVIRSDPGLSAELLKLANSSQFEGQPEASTIERAFMRVGSRMMANALLESHLLQVFDARDPAVLRLWMMSALGGHLAQFLAEQHPTIGIFPQNAYSYGLLHDVGYLVLVSLYPDRAWSLLRRKVLPSRTLQQQERAVLGVTHTVAGGLIASRWRLPRDLVAVITEHHKDEPQANAATEVDRAMGLMGLVDDLVFLWLHSPDGSAADAEHMKTALGSLDRQILYRSFGIGIPDLAAALGACVKAVDDKRAMLGLPKPEPLELPVGRAAD
jgi:HD-like signal output (HDOD) protein